MNNEYSNMHARACENARSCRLCVTTSSCQCTLQFLHTHTFFLRARTKKTSTQLVMVHHAIVNAKKNTHTHTTGDALRLLPLLDLWLPHGRRGGRRRRGCVARWACRGCCIMHTCNQSSMVPHFWPPHGRLWHTACPCASRHAS